MYHLIDQGNEGINVSILSKFIKANYHYNLAVDAIEKKRYQEALNEFNRTLQLNPHYTLAFINRGKLLQQHLNHLKSAAVNYEKALKLDPHDDQTRYRLANLYRDMGEYQKSAQHYRYILIDVDWEQKSGASLAFQAFGTKQYQKAAQLMHRILSSLDFH